MFGKRIPCSTKNRSDAGQRRAAVENYAKAKPHQGSSDPEKGAAKFFTSNVTVSSHVTIYIYIYCDHALKPTSHSKVYHDVLVYSALV